MKKTFIRIFTILTMIIGLVILTGCNKTLIDTQYVYNKAILYLPSGEVINIDVKSWKDYEGEQLQIISEDDKVYLTSSFNCVLIKE